MVFILFSLMAFVFTSYADEAACNNKYKNLVKLQNVLRNDPYAKVPPFFEISSARIEKMLAQPSDPDFYDLYYITLDQLRSELGLGKRSSLRSYIGDAYRYLGEIYRSVQVAFKKKQSRYKYLYDINGEKIEIWPTLQEFVEQALGSSHSFMISKEMNFLEEARSNNLYLMVRSSGLEDSKTTANAGLYVSVPYVKPEADAVREAMLQVVKSYFNPQALKNNLIAGLDLHSMQLCIPVLVQQLIGEPFGGTQDDTAIPVSGVAFTTQSSLSSGNFKITEINASYGHGEGVVANKVSVDRYYVTESRISNNGIAIYPMVTYKRQRLVTTGVSSQTHPLDTGLQLIKNPEKIAAQPCLSTDTLEHLYAVLKKIETAYGQPMDVEFVVLKGTIYIVQARPAMKSEQKPSYIPDSELTEVQLKNMITVNTLVSGSSQVVVVADPEKLIIKDTLDDADADERRSKAQAVLVGAWASPLSHAAVNFIGFGTPCFYVQDLNTIKTLAASVSAEKPLVIDTQRQLVYLWDNQNKNVTHAITQGWYEHPIARSLSIIEGLSDYRVVRDMPVVPQDAVLVEKMSVLKNVLGSDGQSALYKEVAERIRDRVQLTEKRMQRKEDLCDPVCVMNFASFKKQLFLVIDSFQRAIDNNADRLELLFYHKMLEALLYQDNDGSAGINQYTYRWFLDDLFIKQMLRGRLRIGNIAVRLLEYAKYCSDKELVEKWRQCVSLIDQAFKQKTLKEELLDKLGSMLALLEKVNGVSLWFATQFYRYAQNENYLILQNIEQIVDLLTKDYTESTQEFIFFIQSTQDNIETARIAMQQKLDSATAFESFWKEMHRLLIFPLTNDQFIGEYAQASSFSKLLLCTELRKVVDILDESIKMMKSSHALTFDEKKSLFKLMLKDFLEVCKRWLNNIMPEHVLTYHSSWPLYRYLSQVDSLFTYIIDTYAVNAAEASYFQKSAGFSVQAAVLGSKTAFERHFPTTPEDMFMLIHQNALVAVSAIYKSLFSGSALYTQIYMPAKFRMLFEYLDRQNDLLDRQNDLKESLIGIVYDETYIRLFFNMPLRNHSATFQLVYNFVTQESMLQVQYLGQARLRWEQIAVLAAASPEFSHVILDGPIILDRDGGIVAITWKVDSVDVLQILIEYLKIMNELSFDFGNITYTSLAAINKTNQPQAEVLRKVLPLCTTRIKGILQLDWNSILNNMAY